jgi:hypothetical protein
VKGRHRIPVIRQTEATPHQIGHASSAQIMHNKVQGPAEIEHFLAWLCAQIARSGWLAAPRVTAPARR